MPFNETHMFEFRLEAFNVLNHPFYLIPNGNIRGEGAAFPASHRQTPMIQNDHRYDGFDAADSVDTEVLLLIG
jgi:hypothetical protein